MDWIAYRSCALEYIKKYRFVVIIILIGILLLILPQKENNEESTCEEISTQDNLQDSLEEILCLIHGVGKVEVLLTKANGEKTIFQTDDDISKEKAHKEVVLITNSAREETGLVQQVIPPKYLGAVVVCQGAENASVRLSVVEAVMSVTGLTSDNITVLKMK